MLVLAILTLQVAAASAQSLKAQVKSIDAYCKTIDALAKKTKKIVVADTSDYMDENAKPKWQKFASEKALEKFREDTETYSIAFNWLKNGKIVLSNFTNFSPSGDWTKYTNHYFRQDGTLAKAAIDYRTFQGDIIVLRSIYFDANGKELTTTTKYKDLNTQKTKTPEAGSFNPGSLNESDHYLTTEKLPFRDLITKK